MKYRTGSNENDFGLKQEQKTRTWLDTWYMSNTLLKLRFDLHVYKFDKLDFF